MSTGIFSALPSAIHVDTKVRSWRCADLDQAATLVVRSRSGADLQYVLAERPLPGRPRMSTSGAGLTEQGYYLPRQGGHPWEVGHAPV